MNETSSATVEQAPRPGLCRAGRSTSPPCWRAATVTRLDDTEPTVCPEHAEVSCLAEDADGYRHAVESVRAFLESEAVKDDPYGVLAECVPGWYFGLAEEAAEVTHRYAVAKFLADRGPNSRGPEDPDERRRLASEIVRDTSLGNAYFNRLERRELSVEEHHAVVWAVGRAMANLDEEHGAYWKRGDSRD